MNVETIKSELQQVLDSDLALRKEYNDLKRSLSDYRNQLIERDEDCKRLQVNIDVLTTKLVVMERDNTNFKGELAAFKELRHTIKEQLQDKQNEITDLLSKIEGLNSQLNSIASEYEEKIEVLNASSATDIENLKQSYEGQLAEIKTNSSYQQNGIKSEYDTKISGLTASFDAQIENTKASYESRISELISGYEAQLSALKHESESTVSSLSSASTAEIDAVKTDYEQRIAYIEKTFSEEKGSLILSHTGSVSSLTESFLAEKAELTSSFEKRIEFLSTQLQEQEISFNNELNASIEALTNDFTRKENELKASYEEKLSNTLIHSNAQNTRLSEESNKFVMENEHFKEKIREMVYHIDAQNTQIENLANDIAAKSEEIGRQNERYSSLSSEFETYKASQQLSASEIVSGLNTTVSELTSTIAEKDSLISGLHTTLGERTLELGNLAFSYNELESSFNNLSASLSEKEELFEGFKNELEVNHSQALQGREVEFQKLLTENTNLISEIDATSDKLEAAESELELLRTELSEMKAVSEGKVVDLRDTLNAKNYELTTLAANNSALQTELSLLKAELQQSQGELNSANVANELALKQQEEFDGLVSVKNGLEAQLSTYKGEIDALNSRVSGLTGEISGYQSEITDLKSATKVDEQETFIDGLFKQIDMLNDERFKLLSEKEEMAMQLLKMNDSLSGLSQQVDSQNIDISELDMHRKNVILAKTSTGPVSNEKTAMKKQINELVREIDKCIALLSA